MSGRVQANSSGTKRQQRLRPEEESLNRYVIWQAYLLIAITGIGYLALTWSTVVLLGGFVSTLGKKDFWCLTAISMMQAARILNDIEDETVLDFFDPEGTLAVKFSGKYINFMIAGVIGILLMPVHLALITIYTCWSFICVGLSLWRLAKRDYASINGDGGQANLIPALDMFYSLVLCQCSLYFIRYGNNFRAQPIVASLCRACKFPEKWAKVTIEDYLMDTRAKCRQNLGSIKEENLANYAVDLLGSESSQDYRSGARILDMFIKQEVDVRSLLLPSRPKIQKLIDTLRWRSSDMEIRELAARILAYLAWDIDVSQFSGAIRCICSLLDTVLPYWNNQQEASHQSPENRLEQPRGKEIQTSHGRKLEQHGGKKINNQDSDDQQGERGSSSIKETDGNGWNELILQGLTILERLASDQHNCRDICSTPDLLLKIMAPLYSSTLIQDMNISSWADVVNGSLKLVHKLIRSPEWTGQRLIHEISSSQQALNNLDSLLDQGNKAGKELQMRAFEILTEMTLDSSTNLGTGTKEKLIKKQLQTFLSDDEGEEWKLRFTAGRTLALLCKIENINAFIMKVQSNIFDRLSEILDAKNSITYKTVALEILDNLCTHCILDKNYVMESLLPKILAEVLPSKDRELPREKIFWFQRLLGRNRANKAISGHIGDEEKQLVSKHSSQIKSCDQANEEQNAKMEFREALLSLTLVISDKLISADDFDEVARKAAPGEGEFVAKLKMIVEEHCEARANSLRIVKLCGQIAVTMMERSQYRAHFKDQKFVETLTEASRIMLNLESCMLFAGTDGGAKKTFRPLLSDLVEKAHAMVA